MRNKKNIWITGASSGVGQGLAKAYIEQGHFVIVSGRNRTALNELEALAPDRVRTLAVDLADEAEIQQLSNQLNNLTDVLDLLILAAGVCEYVDHPRQSTQLYRRVMEVNYFAQISCVNIALSLLARSELRPQIVGIGSLSTVVPFPRAEAYGASKAAFEYWIKSLRIDLAPSNIDVSLISPGFINTPLTQKNDFQMPRLVEVDEACNKIIAAIEGRKRHFSFPLGLSLPLKLMAVLEPLWYRLVVPKLVRQSRL